MFSLKKDARAGANALSPGITWDIGVLKNTVVFITAPSDSSVSHTTSSQLEFPCYIVTVGVCWYRLGSHAYFGGRSTEK